MFGQLLVPDCALLEERFFLFFIGALLASVNVFSNSDNLEVKLYFRLSAFMFVGIGYTLFEIFSTTKEGAPKKLNR